MVGWDPSFSCWDSCTSGNWGRPACWRCAVGRTRRFSGRLRRKGLSWIYFSQIFECFAKYCNWDFEHGVLLLSIFISQRRGSGSPCGNRKDDKSSKSRVFDHCLSWNQVICATRPAGGENHGRIDAPVQMNQLHMKTLGERVYRASLCPFRNDSRGDSRPGTHKFVSGKALSQNADHFSDECLSS